MGGGRGQLRREPSLASSKLSIGFSSMQCQNLDIWIAKSKIQNNTHSLIRDAARDAYGTLGTLAPKLLPYTKVPWLAWLLGALGRSVSVRGSPAGRCFWHSGMALVLFALSLGILPKLGRDNGKEPSSLLFHSLPYRS